MSQRTQLPATLKFLLLSCLAVPVYAQTTTPAPPTPPFKQCPPVGASASCAILIVINTNGSANIYSDPNVGPYEMSDDTLIGVQNNSGRTITSLPLNGGSVPIFAFEGDGICDPNTSFYGPVPGGCPFGPYGYEGPGVSFTNINGQFQLDNTGTYCDYEDAWQCATGSGAYTTGTVNFSPGIPPGGSAYFALEEALTASQITVPLAANCPPATATVGVAYQATLTGSGGNGSYLWSLYSGTLGNLTLTPGGVISGIPNAPGTLNFSLQIGDTAQDPIQVQVAAPPPLTLSCNAPAASLVPGSQYSASCTAAGGSASYTWSYSNVPTWLTIQAVGGTATLAGTVPSPPPSSYTPTITVTDSSSPVQTKSQTVTINVGATPLTLTCPATSTATVGAAFSATCSVTGGTPGYTWNYSLPSWLTGGTSGATVTLSGTPPAPPPSSYSVSVVVTDSTSPTKQTKSQNITINVTAPPLTMTCAAPGTANAGTAYSGTCTASGGTPAYTWTYANLPSWLTAGTSGATITFSGTPPTPPPASYTFTATVTDSTASTNQTKAQAVTINVSFQPVQSVTISQGSTSTANQATLSIQFGQAAAATYSGTLALSFTPDPSVTNVPAGYVDPAGGFPISGSTTNLTQSFAVTQGQTQATTQFGLGTVAGTWTATLTGLSGGVPSPAPTYSVSVAAAAPVITAGSVAIVNATSSGFTVHLSGYSTTRAVTSATFVFTPASGTQLTGTTTVTVPFGGLDQSQWFATSAGLSAGGTFSMSLPFSYSGDPTALGSVSVTLTNSKGQTSAPVSGTK
jgi:large repetitive protein